MCCSVAALSTNRRGGWHPPSRSREPRDRHAIPGTSTENNRSRRPSRLPARPEAVGERGDVPRTRVHPNTGTGERPSALDSLSPSHQAHRPFWPSGRRSTGCSLTTSTGRLSSRRPRKRGSACHTRGLDIERAHPSPRSPATGRLGYWRGWCSQVKRGCARGAAVTTTGAAPDVFRPRGQSSSTAKDQHQPASSRAIAVFATAGCLRRASKRSRGRAAAGSRVVRDHERPDRPRLGGAAARGGPQRGAVMPGGFD